MTTTGERILAALQPYDLSDEGNGNYRSNSPLRPNSNSHSFTLLVKPGGEHGAWDDKAGGTSGSLYELAKVFGIDTPKHEAVQDTKRAYKDLEDYAQAHGVTADVFVAAGWSEVITHQKRPALSFVTANGTRYRFLDGEKPPYKSDVGYKTCWYGLRRAVALANEQIGPLILCNGEASTVVAQSFGVAAACITNGEKVIPAPLLADLFAVWPEGLTLIALDCDKTGREAAEKIKAQFIAAGRNARIIDFGLGNHGDLADFCMLHGKQTALKLLDLSDVVPVERVDDKHDTTPLVAAIEGLTGVMRQDAKLRKAEDINQLCAAAQAQIDQIQTAYAAPSVISFSELGSANLTDLDRLMLNPDPIQGLRSHMHTLDKVVGGFQPEVYVIYGSTSMGKSWLAVSLCREFLQQGPGLIVTTESSPRRWLIRLAASLTNIDAEKIETGQVSAEEYDLLKRTYARLGTTGCRALANGQPTPAQVRAAALGQGYKWIVIDSASKMAAPGTSGIYDRTVAVSDGIQNLMTETGLPIIVTSQVGRDVAERANKQPQLEDAYGGGAIEHNAGVVMGLYRHGYYVERGSAQPDPSFPDNMTMVRVLKNRWRPSNLSNSIRLTFAGSRGFYEMAAEAQSHA